MNSNETKAGVSPVLSTAGLCVGGRVRLLNSIYDDGEDHHPPGYLAYHGEVLVIRAVREKSLAVSHEDVTDSSFVIYPGEYETHNIGVQGRPLAGD